MEIKELYNNFLKTTKYEKSEIAKRNYKNLKDRIKELDFEGGLQKDIDILEENISIIKSNKYGCVNAYNKFLAYLKSKGYNVSSSLKKNYETTTRRLELIKFLQTPKNREDIMKEFLISDRTLDTDFVEIEKGIEFCGFPLKIKLSSHEKEGRRTINDEEKKYCSSCNPFGLALNMTELYILLKVIPNQLNDERIRSSYEQIISRIYPQLSDNAINLLNIEDGSQDNVYYVEYEQLESSVFHQLIYFIKTGKSCTVIYAENGERREIRGKISLNYDEGNHASFIVNQKNKETKIKYIDFIGILDKDFKELYK